MAATSAKAYPVVRVNLGHHGLIAAAETADKFILLHRSGPRAVQ